MLQRVWRTVMSLPVLNTLILVKVLFFALIDSTAELSSYRLPVCSRPKD